MISLVHRRAYMELFNNILPFVPENAELRVKACGDFLMVDVFAIVPEGIYTSKICYHLENGVYTKFISSVHTEDGFKQLINFVRELYQPDRQLSFIAELLDINLSDMARIIKEVRKDSA